MPGFAQQNIQSSGSMRYYYGPLSSQSGEIIPGSYLWDNLSLEGYSKQNYYTTIPFRYTTELNFNPLSSTKPQESPEGRVFSRCIAEAIRRHKLVNHVDDYDTTPAQPFLEKLKSLMHIVVPHISFYNDAVKASVNFKQKEFIIDYDYEEPEFIFISTFEDDMLKIKDGKIDQLYTILESF
jgi:hypothetical protein